MRFLLILLLLIPAGLADQTRIPEPIHPTITSLQP